MQQLAAADRLLGQGRLREAIDAYRSLLADGRGPANAWYNLAWAERADHRFDDALASYAKAIEAGMDRPEEAMLNRAAILNEHLFDPALAADELRAALALNPGFVLAWLNLGNIHEDLGEVEAARDAYGRALALDPRNGRARARLGVIAVATGEAAAATVDLQRALTTTQNHEDRAEILFALGGALDDQGDYPSAFQAYQAANLHARAIARTRYDARAHEALIDRIIATFTAASASPPASDQGARPVFICGMFRSGSTLAEQILGRHSAITAAGELETIPKLAHDLMPYPEAVATLPNDEIARLRQGYLDALPGIGPTTDKRCDNFLHIGLIKTLFPEAKIIHTRRGALDNILSVYFLYFGDAITYSHDLNDIAHYYSQYARLMRHWQRLYPEDIHTLDYDALVSQPRDAIEATLKFLGLAWEDACLVASPGSDAIRTASAWQVRKPLHARSSGRWRHYEAQLAPVRQRIDGAARD